MLRVKVACHCVPCRKSSGTPNSFNLMIPEEKFHVTSGTAKRYTRKGRSGKDVTYNSCDHCSSLVFVESEASAGVKILKMGTVDDEEFLDRLGNMDAEIFCKDRLAWAKPIAGAEEKEIS